MKCAEQDLLLYAVTDRHWLSGRSLRDVVEESLRGGVTMLQLREKTLAEPSFLAEARELQALCRDYHVPFIVNDNVDIAVKCHAEGIHVGQDDMKASCVRERVGDDMIIGVSAHTVEEAVEAVKNGADYLGAGAVFGSSTKQNAGAMKKETLRSICEAVDIPVVAIGGINGKNLKELSHTGIDGVALVSAIFAADDIENTCRALRNLTEETVKSK